MMEEPRDAAYRYCQRLTKREAKNFYYGFFLLPLQQRHGIYAAYTFARHCDDVVDDDLPREQRVLRLADCREMLDRCLGGDLEEPLGVALHDTVESFQIPHDYFYRLIDGVEMDLNVHRYQSFRDLQGYCYLVASIVGLISIEIFGYRGGEQARNHAIDLGIALQLTNILRDVQEDVDRGRIYLPKDEMEAFGYSEDELMRGAITPAFRRFLAYQIHRAREYYTRGRRLLPFLPRRARACVGVMAGIYSSILDDIETRPQELFEARVNLSTGHKLALAGRELVRSLVP